MIKSKNMIYFKNCFWFIFEFKTYNIISSNTHRGNCGSSCGISVKHSFPTAIFLRSRIFIWCSWSTAQPAHRQPALHQWPPAACWLVQDAPLTGDGAPCSSSWHLFRELLTAFWNQRSSRWQAFWWHHCIYSSPGATLLLLPPSAASILAGTARVWFNYYQ